MTNTTTTNTNMRKGFTMIELIFVIVIIGILAAVAIPKLAETSKSAHQSNIEQFVATMNTTVGATMWAKALKADSGKIVTTQCALIANYLDVSLIPSIVTFNTTDCNIVVADTTVADADTVVFVDGTSTEGPTWKIDRAKFK